MGLYHLSTTVGVAAVGYVYVYELWRVGGNGNENEAMINMNMASRPSEISRLGNRVCKCQCEMGTKVR